MTSTPARPTRRTVIRGAAWTAPAVVVASAAPAFAASGDAMVTTQIAPTMDDVNRRLPVSITFINSNTGSTGMVTVSVTLMPAATNGVVDATAPAGVTAGWVAGPSTPTPAPLNQGRIFTFTNGTGIPGAATATGTAMATLQFTVMVGPDSIGNRSAGAITTVATAASGQILDGTGAWT